jgi:hypothetical protein
MPIVGRKSAKALFPEALILFFNWAVVSLKSAWSPLERTLASLFLLLSPS